MIKTEMLAREEGERNDGSGGGLAIFKMTATAALPAAAPVGGHALSESQAPSAPNGGEGPSPALAATVAALRDQQRLRRFCIVSQSRCDRSCEAFIARYIGFPPDAAEDQRKAVFKQAQALRKSVERGDGKGLARSGHQRPAALSVLSPVILASAEARKVWDAQREEAERAMRALARTLPVWPWVRTVAGFAELGLAALIGETGDLSNYATKERVWKRLGLAVIDGERQGRRSDPEAAAAHGYDPRRRAEVWAFCSDSMFRAQWRGDRDADGGHPALTKKPVAVPAHAIGPYGQVYERRKAHTATREGWTDAHRNNDALRVMTKAFIEDLWKAWRAGA